MITETESTINVQLKSCPFCGASVKVTKRQASWVEYYVFDDAWNIDCPACPAHMEGEGDSMDDLTAVVAAWNREAKP